MTPEQIAKGLTKAQADALCGRYSWTSIVDEQDGEAELYRLGLWKRGHLKRGEGIHTTLGIAVRAILEKTNDQ